MNNLDFHLANAIKRTAAASPNAMPMGYAEVLRRCRERDKRFETQALEAEREGDEDGCWLAMAARAENQRFIDKIEAHLRTKENAK